MSNKLQVQKQQTPVGLAALIDEDLQLTFYWIPRFKMISQILFQILMCYLSKAPRGI